MLVLSRKRNETVVIDARIQVTVLEIRGDKVRLGIEADRSIGIHRYEVWQTIQDENAVEQAQQSIDQTQLEA